MCSQDRIARYKQFKEFQKRIMAPRKGWDGGIGKFPVIEQFAMWAITKVRWFTYETCWFSIAMLGNFPIIFLSLPPEKWEYFNRIHIIPLKHGNISGGTRSGVCHHQNPLPRGQWEVTPSITTGSVYESNESQARCSPNKSHPSKYSTPPFSGPKYVFSTLLNHDFYWFFKKWVSTAEAILFLARSPPISLAGASISRGSTLWSTTICPMRVTGPRAAALVEAVVIFLE